MRSILRNHRFRRDARTLEDEEEMWFNTDEDDLEDGETVVRTSDKIKTEEDLMEPISKFMERKKCKCFQFNGALVKECGDPQVDSAINTVWASFGAVIPHISLLKLSRTRVFLCI